MTRSKGSVRTTEPLVFSTMPSPVGELTLVASARGLRAILWEADDARVPITAEPVDSSQHPVLSSAQEQLEEYFQGTRRVFDLPLDPVGTPFQLAAWAVLRTIPYGTTMSYGEQARTLGDPNKARAVGAANGKNPLSIIVPCHRVVGTNGSLTGFAGGLDAKALLLEFEAGLRTPTSNPVVPVR
jgi:methylated-DNA-[protein]-cysteine S-methyltransferase